MSQWIEEDADKDAEKERERKRESAAEAAKEHEQWVKKKDSLRIRLPTAEQIAMVVPKVGRCMFVMAFFKESYFMPSFSSLSISHHA